MRVVTVGAGPTGLYLAIGLARRGHEVVVLDRDSGPAPDGSWQRRGVMQFHHPHAFRQQVVEALRADMPDVLDDLAGAGAETLIWPGQPERAVGLRIRRLPFEQVLLTAARAERGVELRRGHVDGVTSVGGRATGVLVDGMHVAADLVLDASGRAGLLGRSLRGPAQGADCGIAYVSRQYQLLPGAEPGPTNAPIGLLAGYPGYEVIVFVHEHGTFSVLIARASNDTQLAALRHDHVFSAVTRLLPALAVWTDPTRSAAITGVLPGGRLYNRYQGQLGVDGTLALPGLIFVGDAVCTTNPTLGRGIALCYLQAHRLLQLLDSHWPDLADVASVFDQWCSQNIRPWFEDHVYRDAELVRRRSGQPFDLSRPLPSDLIMAAAEMDPTMMKVVGPYMAMEALPATLAQVEPRAREIYATGWLPPVPEGPTRDELVEHVAVLAGSAELAY